MEYVMVQEMVYELEILEVRSLDLVKLEEL